MSALVAAAAVALAALASGTGEDPRYWLGTATASDRAWELGLALAGDEARLDVVSLWIADEPVALERGPDGSLAFAFPWDIGRVELRPEGDRLVGALQLEGGERAALDLAPSSLPPTVERQVVLERPDARIAASVLAPSGTGPFPAVVVVHGGGDSSRAATPYRFWGDHLARRGFAVLLYDKRGNGASTGSWRTVPFETRAGDVAAAVAHLRADARVDPERVGLLAVSQGCWIAGLVAAADPALAFVVQVSGPLVSPYEADTHATRIAARRAGLDAAAEEELVALWSEEVRAIARPHDDAAWARYAEHVERARRAPWYERSGYGATTRGDRFARWYALVAHHDPLPSLRTAQAPMLWLYGAHDSQSEVPRNAALLQRLAEQGSASSSRTRYDVRVYEGADHGLLVPADELGRGDAWPTIAPRFFTDVHGWLDAVLAD